MPFCQKCGTELAEDAKFCGVCGTASAEMMPANPTMSPQDITDQYRAEFIGNKYDYYQKKWAYYQITGISWEAAKRRFQIGGMNWAAFFLGPIWSAYRKMYLYTSLYIALGIVLGLGAGICVEVLGWSEPPRGFWVVWSLILAVYGNRLYQIHVDRQIKKITTARQGDEAQIKERLRQCGGTSITGAIGFFAIQLLLVLSIVFSNDLGEVIDKITSKPILAPNQPQRSELRPILGQTFKTGSLEIKIANVFVKNAVGGVNIGGEVIGQSVAPEGALYAVVSWTYKNISGRPISTFQQPEVQLVDKLGQRYNQDVGASAAYAAQVHSSEKILSDLNPGITLTSNNVFEISRDLAQQGGWLVLVKADEQEIMVHLEPETESPPLCCKREKRHWRLCAVIPRF